ncbi:MAG: hypothetical protein ACP5F1_02060 [Thermoplasmata archaeon]|nr:hypothetical protein [Thermoplasmata archaeon]
MEETLCSIEFLSDKKGFVARLNSDIGGLREYKASTFDELLSQVMIELQDEFEGLSEM